MSDDQAGDSQLLAQILDALASVAPEVRELNINPKLPLREQIELDSMDHLHFLISLKQRLGIDVPELQYQRMRRLDDLIAYLQAARGESRANAS
jgi:acyl carrier protein